MSEILYVLIKRDLYERPGHLGYTGVKERAGAWPLSLVESLTVPVKEAYDPKYGGSYAIPQHAAPDFTDACYHDISIDHLRKAIAVKDAEIAAGRDLLAAAKDVYQWMNNLPIPTSGCTTKMQVLYDAITKAEGGAA